jgi:hypothetical protein
MSTECRSRPKIAAENTCAARQTWPGVCADMTIENESATTLPDPAAVFACALSLWQECQKLAKADAKLNLSDAYNGIDEFMREIMRVATQFETWACSHVDFNRLTDVWPYFLEDKFGEGCLSVIFPTTLKSFDDEDCLRLAFRLHLPLINDTNLPIPIDVAAENPIADSPFKKFRIQTVRNAVEDNFTAPYTYSEEPFDPEYGPPYFSLYGIGEDGLLEHIADRPTYTDAVNLAQKLAPGIQFSEDPC